MDDQKSANSNVSVLQGWSKDRKLLVCINSLTRIFKRNSFPVLQGRKTMKTLCCKIRSIYFQSKKKYWKTLFMFFWSTSEYNRSIFLLISIYTVSIVIEVLDSIARWSSQNVGRFIQFWETKISISSLFAFPAKKLMKIDGQFFSPLPFQMMHYLLVSNNPLRNAKCFLC